MAQITTLKDKEGKTLYPITSSQAVLDANGVDLETKLSNKVDKAQGKVLSSNDYTNADKQKLDSLPTSEQLTTTLSGKQASLQDSEDVLVDGNQLSVTERAKMQLFIDQWNEAAGEYGTYNAETGYFELNGITDIGYEEAVGIYSYYRPYKLTDISYNFTYYPYRTLLPIHLSAAVVSFGVAFQNSPLIEVIVIQMYYIFKANLGNCNFAFQSCSKLREIKGILNFGSATNIATAFENCLALETIQILNLKSNVKFNNSPKLSYDSISYMIEKATNTSSITITVHPAVYAKLTGDETNAAYNDLTDEEKEQWTALVTAAAEKNITFATA